MTDPLSDSDRWLILAAKRMELTVREVCEELAANGIDFILIKGWAAARNYPASEPRFYTDVDIAVSRTDHERVQQMRSNASGALTAIDLHREFRHLDSLSWEEHLERSEVVDLDGVSVRIPCPEDHLRILATHWLNDGGANKDRLKDIYYAVSNRPTDFDWSKSLDRVSAIRRGWVICAIGLAHRYFDLDISDLPFRDEAASIPRWVIDTVEREWKIGEPLRPLLTCRRDPKLFLRQLRKRIPPNAIQATIEMEAPIDDTGRALIQLRDIVRRVSPAVSRALNVLKRRH